MADPALAPTPDEATDNATLTPPVLTPGMKTSEFWLKIAAYVLSSLIAAGAIPTTGPIAQVALIAGLILGAFGYHVMRAKVKIAAFTHGISQPANSNAAPVKRAQAGNAQWTMVMVLGAISMLVIGSIMIVETACTKGERSKVISQVEDCAAGQLKNLVPIAQSDAKLVRAGTLTWDTVQATAIAAGESAGGCFLVDVLADVEQAMQGFSGSAAGPSPAPGGRVALARFRAATGTSKTFHTAAADY